MLGWAAVLAFILHPLHERLARRLKGRSALSAGILTGLTPFFVLAPLSVLGVVFAGQVARLIAYLRSASFLSYPELRRTAWRSIHYIGGAVAWVRENAAVSAAQVQGWMTESVQIAAEVRRRHRRQRGARRVRHADRLLHDAVHAVLLPAGRARDDRGPRRA